MLKNQLSFIFLFFSIFCISGAIANAQTTAFMYQGNLNNGVNPAVGNHDFEFALFDAVSGGAQLAGTLTRLNVPVAGGNFSVSLDFGNQFPGASRFLEIRVRTSGGGAFTPLAPRQQLSSTPYSVKSLSADNTLNLGGIPANQYASDAAGSAGFIKNSTALQAASNFNISGTGSANTVNVVTQYNIGGNRVLSIGGATNLFVGTGAGQSNAGTVNTFVGNSAGLANTSGNSNSFFGRNAGAANTSGGSNSFFGAAAGFANTTGNNNAFFGLNAGGSNTVGFNNSMFGTGAGDSNTGGDDNSFFGTSAGAANTGGGSNSFFGSSAGFSNTTGNNNAFFGVNAGLLNTTGFNNAAFGTGAGRDNTAGNSNSFFGYHAGESNTGSFNSFFGKEAGRDNTTGGLNTFIGDIAGLSNTTGSRNTFLGANSGINTSAGTDNTFVGESSGLANFGGLNNSFFGRDAGIANTSGNNNTFVGVLAGDTNTTGSNNTLIGVAADLGANNLTFATAIGTNATVTASGRIQLGRNGLDTVSIGELTVASLTHVCINGTVLSSCSSSIRYKQNVRQFSGGLDLVRRLRPVTFDWAERGEADLGLIAEEVGAVDPLLVTHNRKGEIEGVKYDQMAIVLINAVKELQAQIAAQNELNKTQSEKIERLLAETRGLRRRLFSSKRSAQRPLRRRK